MTAILMTATGAVPFAILPVYHPWMTEYVPGFTAGMLGVAVSTCFIVSSVAAPAAGALIDRVSLAAGRTAVVFGGVLSLGLLVAARNVTGIVLAMVVAGGAQALATTASNRTMSSLRFARMAATLFGAKQTATALVSFVVGLSGSLIVALGWRGAIALFGLIPAALAVVGLRWRPAPDVDDLVAAGSPDMSSVRLLPYLLISASSGLANGAFSTYTVIRLVELGWSRGAAAGVFGVAASLSAASRITAGWAVDRLSIRPLTMIASMQVLGAAGAALVGFGVGWRGSVGVVLAYAMGWGIPGLVQYQLSREFPATVGRATGFAWTGTAIGVSLGPLVYVGVHSVAGPLGAWLAVGSGWLLGAGGALLAARRSGVVGPAGQRVLERP